MNHKLWTTTGARVLAATFVIAGVAACGERETTLSDRDSTTLTQSEADRARSRACPPMPAPRPSWSGPRPRSPPPSRRP
jgi:hypothetical protein